MKEVKMTVDKKPKLWVCVTCGRFARTRHQLNRECYIRAVHIPDELCVMKDNRITRFFNHLESPKQEVEK